MKDKLRKLVRAVRNVFTGEIEKELSDLAIEYFAVCDELEELKDEVKKLAL
jgi:hypothetical protein